MLCQCQCKDLSVSKQFARRPKQEQLELECSAKHYSKWASLRWRGWKHDAAQLSVPETHWIASSSACPKEHRQTASPRDAQVSWCVSTLALLWLQARWSRTLKGQSRGAALKVLECFLHKFFGHDDLRFEFVPGHTTMTATGWPLAQTPDDAIMVLPIFKTMVSFQSLCQQCPELRSLRSRRPLNDFMS